MNKDFRNAAKEMAQPELSEAIAYLTELRSAKVLENRGKAAELRAALAEVTTKRSRKADSTEETAPKKSKKSKKNRKAE